MSIKDKLLATSELLRWEKYRGAVVEYLGNVDVLVTLEFNRNDREVSTYNVVKAEPGSEVNKPSEKKKSLSMKRLRSEEKASKRVIDLTEGECCGKEVSLEDARKFAKSQNMLHGFQGLADLSSVWAGKVATTRYMQVQAARLMCISRGMEIEAIEEEKSQKRRKSSICRGAWRGKRS
ncbi:hypothetical protein PIB30_045637 [Stylosanthes scabra]|uniref:Uncharacterized protein n=1 Tax=Stylosanthes scabra TaxID=79078 RepID=A0ABU6VFQ7_9FABA|nr:hypothetical protein [Stylosanthes scabra]